MKYYDEMANLQVFSKEEINRIVGNSNAAKMILKNYVRSGLIQKIKFNYYATYSIENHQPIANRFVIGSNINNESYISHHSAFEYYGLHNQVFNTVHVSSEKSFKEFKYDEIT
ncbi:MAG: transcriptional regulator, partial [Peptostreptococcaceae bacterium]|nr:transcriptional regulator [Peptostreptococcaceae bacterium]